MLLQKDKLGYKEELDDLKIQMDTLNSKSLEIIDKLNDERKLTKPKRNMGYYKHLLNYVMLFKCD